MSTFRNAGEAIRRAAARHRVPSASQNPDPSWFGQRAHGDRAEMTRVHAEELQQAFVDSRMQRILTDMMSPHPAPPEPAIFDPPGGASFEWHTVETVTRAVQTQTADPRHPDHGRVEEREGDGWNFRLGRWGENLDGNLNFKPRDLSLDEIADALAETFARLRRKKAARLSYLHPGSRKLSLD